MTRLECLKRINRSKHIRTNSGGLNTNDEELDREFVFITNNIGTLSRGNSFAIQEPLAGGTIFQMDKATLESKIFFGELR